MCLEDTQAEFCPERVRTTNWVNGLARRITSIFWLIKNIMEIKVTSWSDEPIKGRIVWILKLQSPKDRNAQTSLLTRILRQDKQFVYIPPRESKVTSLIANICFQVSGTLLTHNVKPPPCDWQPCKLCASLFLTLSPTQGLTLGSTSVSIHLPHDSSASVVVLYGSLLSSLLGCLEDTEVMIFFPFKSPRRR